MKRFSKTVFYLFTLNFLLSTVLFAQTAKMNIDGKPQKSSDEIVGKRDSNGKFCAAIQVVSDMDGFKYQSYNGLVEVDDQPGRDMVYLSPNERVLEIFKSGFEPLKIILSEYGIQLKERDVWKIKITRQAKIGDLLPVTFFVQPQGAQITVNGKTVSSGQAVKLSKGSHRLSISKQGFKTKTENITVSEQNVVFNYTLNEVELEQVVIKSVPNEARIYLDNIEKGTTDDGFFLYPGNYQLKLSKTGYLEVNKSITVSEGGNNEFTYTLSKNSGSLSLTVSPSGAKVLINKEDYSNRSNIELAPGRYKIELSKAGYNPQSETVTIQRGQTLRKTYTLIAKTGKLQFKVKPLNAKVSLKKNGRTVQSWTGMKYLKDLQVGSYELECTASGFSTETTRITIEEQRTAIADIKLKKGYSGTSSTSGGAGTMTDIDGNVYKTVKIGNQIWMAENLKVTRYRNGDPIPNVTGKTQWKNLKTGAYCNYDNNSSNAKTYGRLYNWYAVNDSRNIAPAGWHVPTDKEWKQLENYLGSEAGGKLKERGTIHWKSPNKGATNSSDFTALPGGYRTNNGPFYVIGLGADFWSATQYNSYYAWYRYLYYYGSDVYRNYYGKRYGFSVRLVRD